MLETALCLPGFVQKRNVVVYELSQLMINNADWEIPVRQLTDGMTKRRSALVFFTCIDYYHFMIKKVKFVGIPVKDQGAALKFYTEKLGFKVMIDAPMGAGLRWIELEIPGADTSLVLFTPQGHEDRVGTFQNMAFTSDDVQKTYEELKAKGVTFIVEPKKEDWGTQCQFVDPDGNTFLISSE